MTPEYIIANWTDELLALMTTKFIERHKPAVEEPEEVVSDAALFSKMSVKVQKG